jgi:hypothetical protein
MDLQICWVKRMHKECARSFLCGDGVKYITVCSCELPLDVAFVRTVYST